MTQPLPEHPAVISDMDEPAPAPRIIPFKELAIIEKSIPIAMGIEQRGFSKTAVFYVLCAMNKLLLESRIKHVAVREWVSRGRDSLHQLETQMNLLRPLLSEEESNKIQNSILTLQKLEDVR